MTSTTFLFENLDVLYKKIFSHRLESGKSKNSLRNISHGTDLNLQVKNKSINRFHKLRFWTQFSNIPLPQPN